jgi:hypothetical protein
MFDQNTPGPEDRLRMARARNALLLLDQVGCGAVCLRVHEQTTKTLTRIHTPTRNQAFLPISADSLLQTYKLTEQLGLHPKDILSPSVSPLVLHHLLAGAAAGAEGEGARG